MAPLQQAGSPLCVGSTGLESQIVRQGQVENNIRLDLGYLDYLISARLTRRYRPVALRPFTVISLMPLMIGVIEA
jgi:hypothetical protein